MMNHVSTSKVTNRLVAILLSLAMIFTAIPFLAAPANAETENRFKVELEYYTCIYQSGVEMRPSVSVKEISKEGEVSLAVDQDYAVAYGSNNEPGWASVTVTGLGDYADVLNEVTYFEIKTNEQIQAERVFAGAKKVRVSGQTRYATAIRAADQLLKATGKSKFDNIVVACGDNYPDALSGGYLAKVKNAPVLLVSKTNEEEIKAYIEEHLARTGDVYILGGTGAVSERFRESLTLAEINTVRLGGATRYDTNIEILKAAHVDYESLLVCSGNGYADSLSASAVGLPILLVGKNITASQREYLASIKSDHFFVIGGTGAVSASVDSAIKAVKTSGDAARSSERISGQSRYTTSTEVAKKFFGTDPSYVAFAYGQNFPDGLAGGPLAMAIGAPLILVDNKNILSLIHI